MAAATERPRRAAGPDRLTVVLLALAGFFVMLAVLATELNEAPAPAARPVVVLRRVYETRVVETVPPNVQASGGSSVTQSVSSSGGGAAVPVTRTSGG